MKSGVYALHNAFYRFKYPNATYVKYGHSRDIANRYVAEDSSRLPEDSHLNDIKEDHPKPDGANNDSKKRKI